MENPDTETAQTLDRAAMEHRFRLLHYRVQSQRLARTWLKFTSAGFAPILIKGWAAAQLYPQPCAREYTDIDLVFAPEEFQRAEDFLKLSPAETAVDLHCGVRHLDSLPFADLFANSISKECENVPIRILREEDHLRVLCIHWLNDGGADRERLRDIYYGIENRSENFDWSRFLDSVSRRRRRWLVCAVGLAHRFLDLDLADTPLRDEAKNLPGWLVKTVEREWSSGVRLIPLQNVLNDKKQLWQQIKKRLPPNPLQATIETEGDFDRLPRFVYQLADILLRLPPSIKKIAGERLPGLKRGKSETQ